MGRRVVQHRGFQTTRWSLVERARHGRDPEALNDLLERLWWPIFWWLRRSGRPEPEAEDLTQEFVQTVIIGRGLLDDAMPERGRLRSLVLASLKRFLIDQHRKSKSRGAAQEAALSVDETGPATPAADEAFDREWNTAMLGAAMDRTRRRLERAGRHAHWQAFELRILGPATTGCAPAPLEEVASRCAFETPALAAAAVQHVRKKALAALREVVSESAPPGEAEEEYQLLLRSLSR